MLSDSTAYHELKFTAPNHILVFSSICLIFTKSVDEHINASYVTRGDMRDRAAGAAQNKETYYRQKSREKLDCVHTVN